MRDKRKLSVSRQKKWGKSNIESVDKKCFPAYYKKETVECKEDRKTI